MHSITKPLTKLLAERYGGKRALLQHVRHSLDYWAGRLQPYARIDPARVTRVVFVCKGNICRSAYAQAVALSLGLNAASFGLDTPGDERADPIAARNGKLRGIDLSVHITRTARTFQILPTDLLIAMEPSQAAVLTQLAGGAQVTLLGLWSRPRRPYIQDPYGRSDEYFQRCFALIDSGIRDLARTLHAATASQLTANR